MQGRMMLNIRRLTGLTSLMMAGFSNLVGDAPVSALATSLPPELAVLELVNVDDAEVKECKSALQMKVYCPRP